MEFYEALKEVLENGKRIRRPNWDIRISIGRGTPYLQSYFNGLPQSRTFEVDCDEILADNWIVVKEKVKKSRTVWINCYRDHIAADEYLSREEADFHASPSRVACLQVSYTWEEEV